MEGRENYFNKAKHISIRNQFEYELVLGIFLRNASHPISHFQARHSTPRSDRAMRMTYDSIVKDRE